MKPPSLILVEVSLQLGVVGVSAVGLADASVPEGALTGGIVGAVVVLAAALVNSYVKVSKARTEDRKSRSEVDQEAEDRQAERERRIRRDALDEWSKTVEDLRKDRELDRQELHELRDLFQVEKMEHAITRTRLDACESDRAELFRRVDALEKHNGDNGGR